MKKIIISLMLAAVLLFTVGCSCSEAAILSFDKLWTTEGNGYSETLTYNVVYSNSYSENGRSFKKSSDLADFNPTITGTYVMKAEILSKSSTLIPDEVKNTGSFASINSSIIKLTADLTLNTEYVYGTQTENKSEFINSVTYFGDVDACLAPIYTSRQFDFFNPYVSTKSKSFTLSEQSGTDVTVYGGDTYKITKDYGEKHQEKEFSYKFKTVLDNAALLFAVRNKNLSKKDSSYTLPVVHPSYGASQSLTLTTFALDEQTFSLDYFGEIKEIKFPVRATSFVLNSVNESGTAQICYVQNGAVDNVNNSLLLKYVEPISNYDGFSRIGSLVYTLVKAEKTV